jgi:hypothetical protein
MVSKFNFNHASTTQYGLELKGILAGSEVLSEKLLPEFQITIADLFDQTNG